MHPTRQIQLKRLFHHFFRFDSELLFFACPKKSNQKKRRPNQFALRVPSAITFAYRPS